MRAKLVAAVLALLALRAHWACAERAVGVVLRPSTRYQTILGWGKSMPHLPATPLLRDQVIEQAVNDFGINRLRFEGLCGNRPGRRSWEWLNDNADPFQINWAAFNTRVFDARVAEWMVPWKRAVEARGEKFDLYVSPSFFRGGSSGDIPPWMLTDPEEYAEWAIAALLRLRDVHGVTADYYCICNEAGNNNAFSPQVVARCIRALMPRLRRLGFPTTVQFPESINTGTAQRYIQALRNDSDVWPWIGVISYHWYGTKRDSLPQLRDFAWRHHLPTAQTEFMHLTIDHLYDDLVLGGTSYWEVYGLVGPDYDAALRGVSSRTCRGGNWYWRFRQVSHYVRPGAVRIECMSSDPGLRCLAFDHDGRASVVLINTTAPQAQRSVTVAGLPAGTYGVSHCIARDPGQELGLRRVGPDGRLAVDVAPNSVLTIYAHRPDNLAPTVIRWLSDPDYLTVPASSVQLTCAATDPELDPLSCTWSVISHPPGARATLEESAGWQVRADGLTVPGDYVFAVQVSDGSHVVMRHVLVKVFAGNQPPVALDVHNRTPVWVTVKDGGTLLRSGARDVEGDKVRFRWNVVRQPARARVGLETPGESACKVTGMTVPGDYVFRLDISDAEHVVAIEHTVPVYP